MGISGLLPLLKSIHRPVHVREYHGKTLAIDGYCWLHKAAFGCAMELGMGLQTEKFVESCMQRIHLLLQHKVTPYVVFDGGPLPMKSGTESDRLRRRQENMEKAKEYLRAGDRTKAMEFFQQCIDITPELALQWIKHLRHSNISYVVAPYEADAQLAYLERTGLVDGVITEDSDLLVFGCKRVLYKMDRNGNAVEIRAEDMAAVEEVNFRDWSMVQFRHMCILSGCDYLPSIPGMGLKTAYKLLKKFKTVQKVLATIARERMFVIPEGYAEAFQLAEKTFLFQRVFDPSAKRLTHLTPIEESLADNALDFVGPHVEDDLAYKIAIGRVDPITKCEFPNFDTPIVTKKTSKTSSLREPSASVEPTRIEKQEDIVVEPIPELSVATPHNILDDHLMATHQLFASQSCRKLLSKQGLANPFQLKRKSSMEQQLITKFTTTAATSSISSGRLRYSSPPCSQKPKSPSQHCRGSSPQKRSPAKEVKRVVRYSKFFARSTVASFSANAELLPRNSTAESNPISEDEENVVMTPVVREQDDQKYEPPVDQEPIAATLSLQRFAFKRIGNMNSANIRGTSLRTSIASTAVKPRLRAGLSRRRSSSLPLQSHQKQPASTFQSGDGTMQLTLDRFKFTKRAL